MLAYIPAHVSLLVLACANIRFSRFLPAVMGGLYVIERLAGLLRDENALTQRNAALALTSLCRNSKQACLRLKAFVVSCGAPQVKRALIAYPELGQLLSNNITASG